MKTTRETLVKDLISLSELETEDPEISVSDLMKLPYSQQISASIETIACELSEIEMPKQEILKKLDSLDFTPPPVPKTWLESYK